MFKEQFIKESGKYPTGPPFPQKSVKNIFFSLMYGHACSFFFVVLNVKLTSKKKKYDELKCHYEEVCGAHSNHHFVSALLTRPQN